MSNPITLNLPDDLYHQAETLSREYQRDIKEVLIETLALLLVPLKQPISSLSDSEIITLTQLRLSFFQENRLRELCDRSQADIITEEEHLELQALMKIYEEKLVQQAQALNEAVKRGLIPPLEA
jgi:hypothetical protein